MNQIQKNSIAKVLLRLGTKILCSFILILLAVPFQLSMGWMAVASAAQKLPVLQLEAARGKVFQSVLNAVEAAGYMPRTIREEDFMFNVTPQTFRYILVPLGNRISDESLAMLSRYVSDGGKVVLIPPDGVPDASVKRLFQIVGLPVSGVSHVPDDMTFFWKGIALPGSEALPANSRILTLTPTAQVDVLATWGSDYPAIVSTTKGALLNWQWGRQLSALTNLVALSKVMPLARPESFITGQPSRQAERVAKASKSSAANRNFSNAAQTIAQEYQAKTEALSYQSSVSLSKAPAAEAQSVSSSGAEMIDTVREEQPFPLSRRTEQPVASSVRVEIAEPATEEPAIQGADFSRFPMLHALEPIRQP
jgi:hypothetical protein